MNPVWSRLWRKMWMRRLCYSFLGSIARKDASWRMLNCGYLCGESLRETGVEANGERLYEELCSGYLNAGDDVLEVGCGRGGGSLFLAEHFKAKVVGTDFSRSLVRHCRRNCRADGLSFRHANVLALPFGEEEFDAVVSVELSHCVEDKIRFLDTMYRVLKPGGVFLWSDFFYARPTAMHAIGKSEEAIEQSDFELVEQREVTAYALASMEADSPRREVIIEKRIPKFLHEVAHEFAGTTRSPLYKGMKNGRTKHLMFVLRKGS